MPALVGIFETPGPVVLVVHPPDDRPEGISVWVDGETAPLADGRIEFAAEAGRRRITLAIDRARHAEGALRVTFPGGAGNAEASVVKGW